MRAFKDFAHEAGDRALPQAERMPEKAEREGKTSDREQEKLIFGAPAS